MATELNALPESIVAGESLTATLTGVSTTGRTCSYLFKTSPGFSVACTVVDGVFSLNLTPEQTLLLRAGNIRFVAMATTTVGGAAECVDSGYILVEPSPLATSSYSTALAAVEAAIAKYAGNANKSLMIEGMSIQYRDLEELIALKSYYMAEISRDLGGRGSGPMRILSRFV